MQTNQNCCWLLSLRNGDSKKFRENQEWEPYRKVWTNVKEGRAKNSPHERFGSRARHLLLAQHCGSLPNPLLKGLGRNMDNPFKEGVF